MEVMKIVEVINPTDHPIYLPQSNDPKEDKIIPVRGKFTYTMSLKQLEYLKATALHYNVKN